MKLRTFLINKNLKIIFLLFLNNSMFSQDFIKSDTLKVEGKTYETYHISFGNTSGLKLFKVMTCETSKMNQIKKEIINCNKNNKLEFTEFYIIAINNCKNINSKKDLNILKNFINKIDKERMSLKLSTALIKSKFKIEDFTYEYFLDKPKNNIIDFKNYKLRITSNEVCDFLKK